MSYKFGKVLYMRDCAQSQALKIAAHLSHNFRATFQQSLPETLHQVTINTHPRALLSLTTLANDLDLIHISPRLPSPFPFPGLHN